jgi:hypothetical protein
MFPIVINHASKVLPHWLLTGAPYSPHALILQKIEHLTRFDWMDCRVRTNRICGTSFDHRYIGSESGYLDSTPSVSVHIVLLRGFPADWKRSKANRDDIANANLLVSCTGSTQKG